MDCEVVNWIENWFVKRNSLSSYPIGGDDDFYKNGLVDSFGIIELIGDVEDHYGIMFDDEDFKACSFRTLNGLVELVNSRLNNQV